MKEITLAEAADVIRSKNAGPFLLTLDIILRQEKIYNRIKSSGLFTPAYFEELYGLEKGTVKDVIFFDPAFAVKVTMARQCSSGDVGDSDIYGAQQHVPLLNLRIP